MNKLVFDSVSQHPQILEFISASDRSLELLGYTNHGLRHVTLVARRAREVAREVGLDDRTQEIAAIAGFCHDMGNFMGRTQHHYWGGLLFHQVFQEKLPPAELVSVVQAIANHDKEDMKFSNPVAAVLVLADKSDVDRSRVREQSLEATNGDIHDRVNYGTLSSDLSVDSKAKRITLSLTIDVSFVPILEYFEIFTERMSYCRRAAEYLGYRFGLVINEFQLL
ncbi:MAG: HD domain-containing protein [Patescibacteria group bacterium]